MTSIHGVLNRFNEMLNTPGIPKAQFLKQLANHRKKAMEMLSPESIINIHNFMSPVLRTLDNEFSEYYTQMKKRPEFRGGSTNEQVKKANERQKTIVICLFRLQAICKR